MDEDEEGDGEGLLFLLCFFTCLSRFEECDLVCFFFFLYTCRCFDLSLEEEDERRREELEVEECFLFLCDFFFFPLVSNEKGNDYDVSERQSRKSGNDS